MTQSEADTAPMAEDVTTHTLGPYVTHPDDNRMCGYHNRLGMWVTYTDHGTVHCLRDHG